VVDARSQYLTCDRIGSLGGDRLVDLLVFWFQRLNVRTNPGCRWPGAIARQRLAAGQGELDLALGADHLLADA
jgi:hypothetical protein